MERRLYRSQKDKIIGGVAGGLGEYFEIDPVIVRIIFVAVAVAGGWGIIAYILCWIIIPVNPAHRPWAAQNPTAPSPVPSASTEAIPSVPPTVRKSGTIGGIVLVVAGILLLGHNLIPRFDLWEYWPAILILAGIGLLAKAKPRTAQVGAQQ